MAKLNENIVPLELIVGISGDLCFVTYMETKGKITQINSEVSWSDWSSNSENPLKVKNKFSRGFRVVGVNQRYSSRAANEEKLLIEHPLFKKNFEISLPRLLDLLNQCNIVDGAFDTELIMTKKRIIVTRKEYEGLCEKQAQFAEKKRKLIENGKAQAVKPKDQIPGTVYKSRTSDQKFIYLGEVMDKDWDEPKFAYMETCVTTAYEKFTNWGTKYSATEPTITNCDVRDTGEYSICKPYYLTVLKNKKPLAYVDGKPSSLYEEYSEKDWENIYKAYEDYSSFYGYFHNGSNKPILNWKPEKTAI